MRSALVWLSAWLEKLIQWTIVFNALALTFTLTVVISSVIGLSSSKQDSLGFVAEQHLQSDVIEERLQGDRERIQSLEQRQASMQNSLEDLKLSTARLQVESSHQTEDIEEIKNILLAFALACIGAFFNWICKLLMQYHVVREVSKGK